MLSGLADGAYTIEFLAAIPLALASGRGRRGFTNVDGASALPRLIINEVLASNNTAVANGGTFPDLIELYDAGATMLNLAGLSITDNPASPTKYVFPIGTTLAAGEYLVLNADDPSTATGLHLGFNLNGEGEGVWLYDSASIGGALLDSVQFGPQAADWSLGRVGHNEAWGSPCRRSEPRMSPRAWATPAPED